jgi:hypothetical protein
MSSIDAAKTMIGSRAPPSIQAGNESIQTKAKRKTGGDAKANTGSGRERHARFSKR